MVKKRDLPTSIAELLPDGIDVNLINKIADIVNEYTVEKVNEETAKLAEETTRKVKAFIRGNIEKLKEQAVKELELENETFRNAQLFETIRSMFSVELTGDDEINAANVLGSIGESQDQKIGVLVSEVDRLIQENITLKGSAKILMDKNKMLESSVTALNAKAKLSENKDNVKGKTLSDTALVVSSENFKPQKDATVKPTTKSPEKVNEWLIPSVMNGVKVLVRK
jgi:hypothetical protein